MRNVALWTVVAGLVLSGAAAAQPPGGGRGGQGGFGGGFGMGGRGGQMGMAMLLMNEGVQKELKITDEQKEKLQAKSEELMTSQRDVFAKLRDVPEDQRREKMQEAMKTVAENTEKALKDIINETQMKRLKQIQHQQGGLLAFTAEDVQKALKLTDEQKEKLKTLGEEMRKDTEELRRDMMNAARSGGNMQDAMNKMRTVNKEYMAKAVEMFTDSQKATWKELTGEPFELRFEPRRPGGDGTDQPRRPRNRDKNKDKSKTDN